MRLIEGTNIFISSRGDSNIRTHNERNIEMKPSVLIVDDESVICSGLSRLLKHDYITYTAYNGIEALDILKKNENIDVILCDIKMPGMNGIELIEKIRTENKDLYILVITAAASPITVCDAIKKGANYYIRKPFDIKHLETTLQKAVSRSKGYTSQDTAINSILF